MDCVALILDNVFALLCSARLTGEWHSVAILDFVGHRCLAILIPTRDGSWGASWRAPLEE